MPETESIEWIACAERMPTEPSEKGEIASHLLFTFGSGQVYYGSFYRYCDEEVTYQGYEWVWTDYCDGDEYKDASWSSWAPGFMPTHWAKMPTGPVRKQNPNP